MSLSLEEKKRLAKEQEMQEQFKSQSPIKPASVSQPVSTTAGPRDLTSSLMNMDMMGSNRSNMPLLNAPNAHTPKPVPWTNASNMSNTGNNAYQSLGPVLTTTNVNRGSPTLDLTRTATNNFTGLDSLMTSAKQSHSMMTPQQSSSANAFSQKPVAAQSPAGAGMFAGQRSMAGSRLPHQGQTMFNAGGMAGNMYNSQQRPMPPMSAPVMMGNMQANSMTGNRHVSQPTYAVAGTLPFQQMTTMNNMAPPQQQSTKKLSSQELADFLG